jgi:TonB family protein
MPWMALLGIGIALALLAPHASAQEPSQPPPEETPSGHAVPSGASGAVIVPPKQGETPPPVPVTPPAITHFEHAEYPKEALAAGVEGTVTLVLDIDANGAVTNATVPNPIGHGFDEAAIAAARKFVFDPAKKGGTPVAARIRYKYNFTLTPAAGETPKAHVPQKTLEGRVVSTSTNAAIENVAVVVTGQDGLPHTTLTAADGSWSFLDLPTGKYHIVVDVAGFTGQTVDEDILEGKATSIVFRLTAESSGDEVTVHGTRPPREVTRVTLEKRELTRIPGTNGDALRSLLNLPGVARPPALAGLLIVRGSAPQDTQIFVDGTPIPIVYHFGGLSSVVPSEMLDRIDFYPGNFSSQYGRAMGGIVDVGMREATPDGKYHGLAQVDLIDARVLASGPIANTGWDFAVGGRRSWVDVWLKPVLERTGAGVSTAPVYYDYQAMVEKKWSKNQSFRVLFFGSDDRLDLIIKTVDASDPSLGGGISDHTGFWRLQARYRNKISDDTELKITPAFGEDFLDINLGDNFIKLDTHPLSLRTEVTQRLAKGLLANFGVDVLYVPYTVSARFPPPPKPGQPPGGPFLSVPPVETASSAALTLPAFYTELEIVPWKGGRLVPGVRLDNASNSGRWDLAPRFTARQDLTTGFPRTTMKGGVGVFFQPPSPQQTDPIFGQPGLVSSRSLHYDAGVEQELTRHIDASFELWYKQMDLLVANGFMNEGRGHAYGFETLIRYKPDARFFGWLAYTLSRSTREDPPQFIERLSAFDQTHILTLLGSYRLGRGWEFGARFRLVSGSLYTPATYGFYDENASAYLAVPAFPQYGARLPIFHQLDLRVDKTWKFKSWQLGAYLDVQNVYNRANVEGISYNYNSTASTFAQGLPFLPSLGLRAEF